MDRARVYLAGPISGCNEEQRLAWRRELKNGFREEFEFIDPTDNLIDSTSSDFALVQADIEAIRSSDAVLANMWRESIGTAFGMLHAQFAGKLVVACDPNLIGNRMVAFYADAVERTLPAALNAIRIYLRAQRQITAVIDSSGREERFDRLKLAHSIRQACLRAHQSDIGPPRAIVTRTLEKLLPEPLDGERSLATAEIRECVWQALAELAADPMYEADFDGIRLAYELEPMAEGGSPEIPSAVPSIVVHEHPLEVAVRSNGTHSTIWGHGEIGGSASAIFQEMKRVEGITEIVFGPFSNTGSPPARPHVRIQASKTPHLIEGKCYDKGRKGTLQTFQVKVANPLARDAVLKALRNHLATKGHIRTVT